MLDPTFIANISDEAEEVSADLHDDIIKQIVKRLTARLGQGEEFVFSATDKWQIETLQEAGYLADDIRKEIAKHTKTQENVVKKAYESAGIEQTKYDVKVYRDVGISVTADIAQSPTYLRILQAAYDSSMQSWSNFTGTTLVKASYQLFVKECDKAYIKVTTGGESWTKAYMDAVDTVAQKGVEVVYPSGHRDTVETATARAIRTGVAQACGRVTAARAADNGVHLFLTSAHAGARPTHEPWQGKVFWVDWDELKKRINITENLKYSEATPEEKAKYKEFCKTTDIGTVTGLEGANCRHSYGAFFEGMKNPYEGVTFNPKQYQIDQRARALERRVRKTKRAIEALDTARDNTKNKDALDKIKKQRDAREKTLKRQISEYYEHCKKYELKPQENRLKIGN